MESLALSQTTQTFFLRPPFYELLAALPKLGSMYACTSNQSASLVRYGTYWEQWPGGKEWRGGASSSNVRHLMHRWRSAVLQQSEEQRSLRFFDDFGVLLHEVRLQEPASFGSFDSAMAGYLTAREGTAYRPRWQPRATSAADIDITALCRAWDSIAYLGEFSGLLRSFGLSRTQAFRCIGAERATLVSKAAVAALLCSAVEERLPLRVLVNSSGALQTHGSIFRKLHQEGSWLRLEKPHASFQVNLADLASAWVVKRPTQRGEVLSLEIFDAEERTIALFLYHGASDHPDYQKWRARLSKLSTDERIEVADA